MKRHWGLWVVLLLGPVMTHAHIASNGFMVAHVDGQTVVGSIEVAVRDLELAVGIDTDQDGKITWGELRASELPIARYLEQHVHLLAQDRACPLVLQSLQLNERVDGTYAWL